MLCLISSVVVTDDTLEPNIPERLPVNGVMSSQPRLSANIGIKLVGTESNLLYPRL